MVSRRRRGAERAATRSARRREARTPPGLARGVLFFRSAGPHAVDSSRTPLLSPQIKLTAAPATGGNAWALLPRDVRHALRDSVKFGDSVRAAVADLQAVLVRRFLRLCASKDGHEEPDAALKDALRVVRGAASREVVRRKALCAALHDAQYKAADGVLARIRDRPPSASVARDLFRLRKNRFDALRLRTPAAKARFAAATAKWSSAEFRRLLRNLALQFNGDRARAFPGGGASSLEPGVFYGFEDAVRARRRWPSNFASARGHNIPHNSFRHTGASSRPGAARRV